MIHDFRNILELVMETDIKAEEEALVDASHGAESVPSSSSSTTPHAAEALKRYARNLEEKITDIVEERNEEKEKCEKLQLEFDNLSTQLRNSTEALRVNMAANKDTNIAVNENLKGNDITSSYNI